MQYVDPPRSSLALMWCGKAFALFRYLFTYTSHTPTRCTCYLAEGSGAASRHYNLFCAWGGRRWNCANCVWKIRFFFRPNTLFSASISNAFLLPVRRQNETSKASIEGNWRTVNNASYTGSRSSKQGKGNKTVRQSVRGRRTLQHV